MDVNDDICDDEIYSEVIVPPGVWICANSLSHPFGEFMFTCSADNRLLLFLFPVHPPHDPKGIKWKMRWDEIISWLLCFKDLSGSCSLRTEKRKEAEREKVPLKWKLVPSVS